MRGLFDTDAKPTTGQVRVLFEAAVEYLCPECQYAGRGHVVTEPLTFRDTLTRDARNLVLYGGSK